jgi:hypothetical protein
VEPASQATAAFSTLCVNSHNLPDRNVVSFPRCNDSRRFSRDLAPLPVGTGFFVPDMLVFPAMLERGGRKWGDQRMRILAVIAIAMLLAGCEGDRIKQSKNAPVIVAEAFETL